LTHYEAKNAGNNSVISPEKNNARKINFLNRLEEIFNYIKMIKLYQLKKRPCTGISRKKIKTIYNMHSYMLYSLCSNTLCQHSKISNITFWISFSASYEILQLSFLDIFFYTSILCGNWTFPDYIKYKEEAKTYSIFSEIEALKRQSEPGLQP